MHYGWSGKTQASCTEPSLNTFGIKQNTDLHRQTPKSQKTNTGLTHMGEMSGVHILLAILYITADILFHEIGDICG